MDVGVESARQRHSPHQAPGGLSRVPGGRGVWSRGKWGSLGVASGKVDESRAGDPPPAEGLWGTVTAHPGQGAALPGPAWPCLALLSSSLEPLAGV